MSQKLGKKIALYDYIFHFNAYSQKWNAITRNNKEKYFNGELDKKEIISHSSITKLIKIICNNDQF